jgi:hypothetical protein
MEMRNRAFLRAPEPACRAGPIFVRLGQALLNTAAVFFSFVAVSGICNAQVVVKQEPLDMRNGSTVLVDDGTCGKGKLKLVTVTHGNAMPGAPLRAVKCVPR